MFTLFFLDEWIVLAALTALLLIAAEVGYRVGQRHAKQIAQNHDGVGHTGYLTHEVSALGVLALLLGFTFSMTAGKFDLRRDLIVQEANAIGTTALRADLLPEPFAGQIRTQLSAYTRTRLALFDAGIDAQRRDTALAESEQIHAQIWAIAKDVLDINRTDVGTGLFIQSLNEMIDVHGKQKASFDYHIPDAIYALIYAVAMFAFGLSGIAAGYQKSRNRIPNFVMIALVMSVIFFIVDLDRPQRGLLQISQQSMLDVAHAVRDTAEPQK